MAELSKIAQAQGQLVSAWDERHRIFEAMRNPNLTDEQREALASQYKEASRTFEKHRTDALKN